VEQAELTVTHKLELAPGEVGAISTAPEAAALTHLKADANLPPLALRGAQVEAKFKHAPAFGVAVSRGREGFTEFAAAIDRLVYSDTTTRFAGTYRGQRVVLNVDTSSGLVVVQRLDGDFLTGWKMKPDQARSVEQTRSLGGSR
jgi:hypothetical protein